MQRYILRRVAQGILAIFVISTITFALARVSGDPLNVLLPEEASEEQIALTKIEWGLDKPLHMQYLLYLGKLFQGDMGEALAWPNATAGELIVERLPNTLKLSSLALLVSGIIAFVGLVTPHILRLIFGPDHRVLIPMSAIGGAVFVIAADTVARTIIQPAEFRIGILTAFVGAPFFVFLLIRNRRQVYSL